MLLLQTYGKGEEANASGWCNSKESSKVRKWRVSPNFLSLLMQWEYKTKERYLVWKEDRKGNFIVKSYYTSLCVETRVDFPTKEIWGPYTPMRSHFSTWQVVWEMILTIDLSTKRDGKVCGRFQVQVPMGTKNLPITK